MYVYVCIKNLHRFLSSFFLSFFIVGIAGEKRELRRNPFFFLFSLSGLAGWFYSLLKGTQIGATAYLRKKLGRQNDLIVKMTLLPFFIFNNKSGIFELCPFSPLKVNCKIASLVPNLWF